MLRAAGDDCIYEQIKKKTRQRSKLKYVEKTEEILMNQHWLIDIDDTVKLL